MTAAPLPPEGRGPEDIERGESILFADPEGGEYRLAHRLPFGKAVPLPAPLSFGLETGEFE